MNDHGVLRLWEFVLGQVCVYVCGVRLQIHFESAGGVVFVSWSIYVMPPCCSPHVTVTHALFQVRSELVCVGYFYVVSCVRGGLRLGHSRRLRIFIYHLLYVYICMHIRMYV